LISEVCRSVELDESSKMVTGGGQSTTGHAQKAVSSLVIVELWLLFVCIMRRVYRI